jgi:hypothetical protein
MSRILRRPMFRGGRVDGRGTGIASGLGYEKGGRVGYQPGGAVTGGSIMNRLSNFFNSPALNPDGTPVTLPRRNIVDDAAFFLGPGKFLKAGGAGLNAIRQAGKYALKNDDPFTVGKELVEKVPFLSNQYFKQVARPYLSGMKETLSGAGGKIKDYGIIGALGLGGTGYGLKKGYDAFMSKGEDPDNEDAALLEAEEKLKREQEFRDYMAKLTANEKDTAKSKIPGKEGIKESTKEYAEILGKDKAIGKDVSDMLLSFAGKALKDDATVKSAFGEFAAEEAKRPGRGEKIDQAAATLAINEYIAGKKSKADLDRFFMEMDFKKDLSKRQGDEFFATNLAEVSRSKTGYAAIDLTTRMTHPKYGSPIKLDVSEGDTVESLPIATDNFKKVFIEDEAPYRVVAIDFDQTTGKLYKKSIY